MPHWPIKLHDAIRAVLFDQKDGKAALEFVTDEINKRRLFIRQDARPLPPDQVFRCASDYPAFFTVLNLNTLSLAHPAARPTPATKPTTSNTRIPPKPPLTPQALPTPPSPGGSGKRRKAGPSDRRVKRLLEQQRLQRARELALQQQRQEEKALQASHWRPSPTGPTLPEEF